MLVRCFRGLTPPGYAFLQPLWGLKKIRFCLWQDCFIGKLEAYPTCGGACFGWKVV